MMVPYKCLLVTQNYGDKRAATIASNALIVQHFAQRLVLSLVACIDDTSAQIRDSTQLYIQPEVPLEQEVLIRPSKEMNLPPDMILKVVKSLYVRRG